ncbi:radical SAM protein [Dethiothermospora halolimnae]|uniref:radical SAM protein n=1 Tax=Dethiothermospora halolimnae TaxID=3114390 RepID=UPI003CCB73DE
MIITDKIYFHSINKENNIVINSITGAIDILNKEVANILKNKNDNMLKNLDSKIIENLHKRGYIFKNRLEEEERINAVYNIYMEDVKKHDNIFCICPTFNCNLACTYCFEGDITSNKSIMSEEKLKSVFNFIENEINNNDNKNNVLQLFGGEPLLKQNFKIVKKVLEFSLKPQISGVDIITNGVELIDYKDLLNEYKDSVRSIQVTIDGPPNVHDDRRMKKSGEGTFSTILSNIKLMLSLGFNVVVRTNVDSKNIDSLVELTEILENELILYDNFDYYFSPVMSRHGACDSTMSEDQLIKKLNSNFTNKSLGAKKYPLDGIKILAHVSNVLEGNSSFSIAPLFHYCEAAKGEYVAFGPDGKCYPCGQAVGVKELSIGSYFPKIELNKEILNSWKHLGVMDKPKCSKCSISLLCGGGCPFLSWNKTKNLKESVECEKHYKTLSNYLTNYKIEKGLV